MTTEIVIELDRMHRAIRSGDRWAILRKQPDGTYDTLETWAGGRRSIFHKCEERGIVPDRAAEAVLERLPETTGFRDRS